MGKNRSDNNRSEIAGSEKEKSENNRPEKDVSEIASSEKEILENNRPEKDRSEIGRSPKGKQADMLIPQPRLGRGGMIALITLCNVIAPLSTDMYMPALPDMAEYFHTTDSIMNLTLVCFFMFFAIGMLVFGPVSDKAGRRPVILFGVIMYIVSSGLCGLAMNVYFLILVRILQAIGAGCLVAVSTAIVKDQFRGATQGTVLAVSQFFGVLGPVLSPLIGAQIYRFFSWRADFFMQGLVTVAILILALLMKETLPAHERLDVSPLMTFKGLGKVLKNRTFTLFLCCMVLLQIPMMAYISASSYIYENQFGLSSTQYSFYFAATALVSVLGPAIYLTVRRFNPYLISFGIFGVCIICGVMMLLLGHTAPALFAVCFAPVMIMASISRPFSTTILLNLQKGDTGSASSVANFSFTLVGSIGMMLITSLWSDYISGETILIVVCGILGAATCFTVRSICGKNALNVFDR